jgi:hypothetical protein
LGTNFPHKDLQATGLRSPALPAFFYGITTYIRKEKSSRFCPEEKVRRKIQNSGFCPEEEKVFFAKNFLLMITLDCRKPPSLHHCGEGKQPGLDPRV